MPVEHLKPLTALRFFAALWVVLFHFWPKLDVPFSTPMLVEKGYLGVELFFVLSGFILCHVYLPQWGAGRFRYGSFLWARIARVYPLHLATLIGVGALAVAALSAGLSVDGHILSWASLPANLLMVHAWGFAPEAGWNHPSWSISAEFFAYLNFPLFAWAAFGLRRSPWLAAAAALALLVVLYAVFEAWAGFPLTRATIAWGALRIVPCFAYGCAAYLVWRSGAVDRRGLAVLGAFLSGAAVLAAAAAGAADTLTVCLFGPLLVCLASLSSTGSGIGTSAFAVYLGEISYSVYMVCIPWSLIFFNGVSRVTGAGDERLPVFIWLLGVAAVAPIAAASYHLVEKPCRERLRTLSVAQLDRGAKTTA